MKASKHIPKAVVIIHTLLIVLVGVIALREGEGPVLVHGVQFIDFPATAIVMLVLSGFRSVMNHYEMGLNWEIVFVLSLHAVLGGLQYYLLARFIVARCKAKQMIGRTGFPVLDDDGNRKGSEQV